MSTPAAQRKRRQLIKFIDHKLRKEPAVQALLVVGSVAAGTARDDSDIDAVIFLDPLDLFIVPAESIWREADDSFHAYNRRWRIWRDREMTVLRQLPWLPPSTHDRLLTAITAPSHDWIGYQARVDALRLLYQEVLEQLVADGLYGNDPISEAFIRNHEEPGRAWNMELWNAQHQARQKPDPGERGGTIR